MAHLVKIKEIDKTRRFEVARFAILLYDSRNLDCTLFNLKVQSSVQNCKKLRLRELNITYVGFKLHCSSRVG